MGSTEETIFFEEEKKSKRDITWVIQAVEVVRAPQARGQLY